MKVFPVRPLSKDLIERKSTEILEKFDPECLVRPKKLDVRKLIDIFISKEFGWSLDIREGLPSDILGYTSPRDKTVCISEDTYDNLDCDGRSRFTGCHEFAHVVLHRNQMSNRMITLDPSAEYRFRTSRTELKAYQDPEWQANYMAASLLMPKNIVMQLKNKFAGEVLLSEMVERFGVSRHAAELRLKKMS